MSTPAAPSATATANASASTRHPHGTITAPATIRAQTIRQAIGWFARRYLAAHRRLITLIVLAMVIQAGTLAYFSLFVKELTDQLFGDPLAANVLWMCGTVLGIFAIRGLTSLIHKAGVEHVMAKATGQLRTDLVAHLEKVRFSTFDTHSGGELNARIGANVNELRIVLVNSLAASVLGLFTLVFLTVVLLYLNAALALIMLAAFALIALGLNVVNRQIKKAQQRAVNDFSSLTVELETFINTQKSLRLNAIVPRYVKRLDAAIRGTEYAARRQGYLIGALAPVVDLIIGFSVAFVIALGFFFLRSDEISPAALSAFLVTLIQLYNPLRRVTSLGALLRSMSVTIGSIRWIFDIQTEAPTLTNSARRRPDPNGEIEFSKVDFRYSKAGAEPQTSERQIFEGLTCTIPGGKLTMILGPTGSGKSTIPSILLGLYPLDAGEIRVGGLSLDLDQRRALRAQTSYVGQEIILNNESAADNLALFTSDGARPAHRDAILTSLALNRVDLVAHNAPLGPRGSKLSGGQRQRMALAQALVADKPLAIFDEPTSALDAHTARQVVEAIATARKGKTTIMIVHDRSLTDLADTVIDIEPAPAPVPASAKQV